MEFLLAILFLILMLCVIIGTIVMGACAIVYTVIIMAEYSGKHITYKFMVTDTRMFSYETGIGFKWEKVDV